MLTRPVELLAPPHPFAGLVRHGYRAIAIDPPTSFKCRTALQVENWDSRRDVEKHYRTMSFDELAALPIKDLASRDGTHLFQWTSAPHVPAAIELMKLWGFKYSSIAFTWVKLKRGADPTKLEPLLESNFHVGLGLTTRKSCEIVLLGRRGNARRNSKSVRELLLANVREHSRKPDEFFTRVEQYCAGPYVDLFARERRAGWDVWGNETTKFGVAL